MKTKIPYPDNNIANVKATADAAMPKAGGTFTGAVAYASSVAFGSSGANLPVSAVLGCGVSGALVYGDTNYLALRGATGAGLLFQRGGDGVTLGTIDNSGNFTAVGSVTQFSDERLKTDWQALPSDFIAHLAESKVGTYTRTDTGERHLGASAQGFQRAHPNMVMTMPDGTLGITMGGLAAAVVLLSKEVENLKKELAAK